MDPKARVLMNELANIFPQGRIEYQFANDLHNYRLERNGPSHWLYVERSFVDDHTEQELIESLMRWSIANAFRSSARSRWLALSERGVCEVDDNYGR